jgi:hypothetical protein
MSVDNYSDSDNRNHRDELRPRRHDDWGRERHYDSDGDRERSWSPSQRGLQAFGQGVRDARIPSRF